ncbi:hypothetical protein B0H17DRAFT_1215419 [Mycena rosella]|uniref:Uncharacterized protein n=1 Tax=Mycena rosella TaxID=1033263 RepID=A0AAD7CHH4_MYCRO|nr:hypothetical protein B0H17DRAFT_1215419 [Mycena rosella]
MLVSWHVAAVVPGVALSKKALEMTTLCLDVKSLIPPAFIAAAHQASAFVTAVQQTAVAIAAAPVHDLLWVQGVPLTPDQLEAQFPPGLGDDLSWQVVCMGREPGLYASVDDANDQVNRVPNQSREKKKSRAEALTFYCIRYGKGKVEKWNEVPEDDD